MQNEARMKFIFFFLRSLLTLVLSAGFPLAKANISERQSLAPVEWERDFVETHSLGAGIMRLFPKSEIVDLEGQTAKNIYGLQLLNHLRDGWKGRLGFHLGRTGPSEGQYIWTFFGTDLQHSLLPEFLSKTSAAKHLTPFGFFGLAAVSRWENMTSRLNPVPALRYNVSEGVFYAGALLLIPFAPEFMMGIEYRFLQSVKESKSRGGAAGMSVYWGQIHGM